MTALTLFGTLFATTGGFGAVFNYLIFAQVRCHNRISIYLAFLALFASCWALDRLFADRPERPRWSKWAARLRWPAFLGVIVFGIWDQTDDKWFPDLRAAKEGYVSVEQARGKVAAEYWEDREFYQRVEAIVPGGMVFYYPHLEFPEAPPYQQPLSPGKTDSYEPGLGYLHTHTVRWSYGAMKGRECDTWMRDVCGEVLAYQHFVRRLVLAGFDGLLIDARGLTPKRFHDLKDGIETQALGQGALREVHPTRKLYFYDLREYREFQRRNMGAARFEELARAELNRVYVLWLSGFASFEPLGREDRSHWCPKHGSWMIVNNTGETVTRTVQMTLKTTFKGAAVLKIRGGDVWSDEVEFDQRGAVYRRALVIPPGRHPVHVRCDTSVSVLPLDSRNDLFSVLDFKLDPPR
jgi:hypothetical protein